jgi:Spy/CpxP family protein refolding chaperone
MEDNMKSKVSGLCILLFTGTSLCAQPQAPDPLQEYLFAPELLMQNQEEIGLTAEQRVSVQAQLERAQTQFQELQPKLRQEIEAMASLVKQNHVEEQAALAELNKVLDFERELKRLHLGVMLRIKNTLTAEQQVKLRDLKRKIAAGQARSPEEMQRALQAKMEKVQEGVQRWQDDGRDTKVVSEIMKGLEKLKKAGKIK